MQWLTLALAALAIWLTLRRLWMLDWRQHRLRVIAGYVLLGCAVAVAGNDAMQSQVDGWSLAAVVLACAYLLRTIRHWHLGVPSWAQRQSSRDDAPSP